MNNMKKSVFYGMAILLFLLSLFCLLASSTQAESAKYFTIFVAVLVIDDVLLCIEEGWDFGFLLIFFAITVLAVLLMGVLAAWINASPDLLSNANFDKLVILGTRWLTLIWSFATLIRLAYRFEGKPKEEK